MDVGKINIVLTGPESTAKSSIAKYLAEKFEGNYIPEFARVFLEKRQGVYDQNVLADLWKLHLENQQELINPNGLNILDTDLENYMIWFQHKYGNVPQDLLEAFQNQSNNLYLLMYPDTPWAKDTLRENPRNRLELFVEYKSLLDRYNLRYLVIKGVGEERRRNANQALSTFLNL